MEYKIHAWYQYAPEGSWKDGYFDLGPGFSSRDEAVSYLEDRMRKGLQGGYMHPDYWMDGSFQLFKKMGTKLTLVQPGSEESSKSD